MRGHWPLLRAEVLAAAGGFRGDEPAQRASLGWLYISACNALDEQLGERVERMRHGAE